MESDWKEKYVRYVVDYEGRLVHPSKRFGYGQEIEINSLYDTQDEAIDALEQFYKDSKYISDHCILQRVYVKAQEVS